MEEKENRMTEEKIADSSMTDVSGGSWMITEDTGKEAGLSLRNPDGTPGEWGYLWNSGDYYWQGNKVTDNEAAAIVQFYKQFNRRPFTVREAVEFDKSLGPRHDVD